MHSQDKKKNTGWIGLFECINDVFTAQKLLTTALEDLQKKQVNRIIGPGRFNASSQVGLQIEGFHFKPYFMEPFNPPYYENFFASKGEKETDWFSFGVEQQSFKSYLDRIHRMETKYGSLERQLANKGIRIYSPPKKEYMFEVNRIISLYNELWNTPSHPQFSPLLENEQNDLRKSIQLFSETSLIHIMENQKKDILGINITVPDINELFQTLPPASIQTSSLCKLCSLYCRDCKGFCRVLGKTLSHSYTTARVLILGTKMPGNGLDAALCKRLFEDAMKIGIKRVSASQIAETNLPMMNPLLKMGAIENNGVYIVFNKIVFFSIIFVCEK